MRHAGMWRGRLARCGGSVSLPQSRRLPCPQPLVSSRKGRGPQKRRSALPFRRRALQDLGNLGEKAGGLLDLWVTFCFHFLTGGKAGNQTEQFDLDSQPLVILVFVPVLLRRPNSRLGQELLEISEHGGVRFKRPIRPPMECQVFRGKVGKGPSLVQESKPGINFAGRDFNIRRDSPAGRERPAIVRKKVAGAGPRVELTARRGQGSPRKRPLNRAAAGGEVLSHGQRQPGILTQGRYGLYNALPVGWLAGDDRAIVLL